MRLLHRWAARGTGALAVCAALGVAACGGGDGNGGGGGGEAEKAPPGGYKTFGGGPPGGVLIVLWDREPDNLNPLTFDSSPSYNLVHLMFRALAKRDSTLSNYTPDLLQSWQVNGNTVVMKVRPGLKWHDGRPVTADDVVFTIERQKDENVGSPRKPDVEGVQTVRATDPMTVEATLSRMSPAAVNALLEVVPVPKHILEGVAPAQMRFHAFSRNPVGNGLYRFGSWEQNRQVTVNANTDAPERPSLDRIIVRNVPEPSARLTSLLNGEGDLAKVSADQKGRVESTQSVKLHHTPRVRPGWIAWNVSKPPVDDIRVRQAFLMAINRPALVQGLLGKDGEPALSPIPPALREHSRDVRPIPHDVAGAGRLLDAAGWRDTNGDGVRDKGGRPLNLEVEFSSSDPIRPDMLVGMQSQAKQAGINLVLKPMESTTWVSRLRARQFQGSFWGWGWGPGVMAPNAEAIWHQRSIPPGGANFAGYNNPRVNSLIDSLLVEADTARARGMWRTLEQTAIDDAVYAPIFLDPEFYGVSARYQNVKFRGPEWWEDVIYWSVPTNRRTGRDRMGAQAK
jgi:peptide/nickel transport system substrate-binding protein